MSSWKIIATFLVFAEVAYVWGVFVGWLVWGV